MFCHWLRIYPFAEAVKDAGEIEANLKNLIEKNAGLKKAV